MVRTRRGRTRRAPPALECRTVEEILQRRAYEHLRRHGRERLAVITELVRVGNTDCEVVEHFARQTGRDEWELAHVELAAAYSRRQLEIIDVRGVH